MMSYAAHGHDNAVEHPVDKLLADAERGAGLVRINAPNPFASSAVEMP
jgi:hypothetical protein